MWIKKLVFYTGALLIRLLDKVFNVFDDAWYFVRKASSFWFNDAKLICKGWTLADTWSTIGMLLSGILVAVTFAIDSCKSYARTKKHEQEAMANCGAWRNLFEWARAYLIISNH